MADKKRLAPLPAQLFLGIGLLLSVGAWFYAPLSVAAVAVLLLCGYDAVWTAARERQGAQGASENRELPALRQQLRREERAVQRLEFDLLQKQISAHFAVNVMNLIPLLVEHGEKAKAKELCTGLAFLLQYANEGDELVDGLDELFILERYLTIMAVRYPGRFTASYDVAEVLEDLRLPRMLLQPLVENAVMHGFREREQGGRIEIRAAVEAERLILTVEDNGCGISPQALAALEQTLAQAHCQRAPVHGLTHIALQNIQSRLRTAYGAPYGLRLHSALGQGTTCILTLPLLPIGEFDRLYALL